MVPVWCSQTLQLFSYHVALPVGRREQQGQQLGVSVQMAQMLLCPCTPWDWFQELSLPLGIEVEHGGGEV